ncbi:MFS transporter [Saccharopolyspora spinosa]|uniref:MHS family proline/betaine transporter-like MFS transporter n=1 Tax=Saccharopolyspora spinosa TaxID=60894 RepID=A0A2N3Y0H1_SACSN|nr:MFS transporter [Saccharopolyspora spinosa]PKW16407.1 MHS family proline/betaine transporter-like MFS transporter [Saccharopolyspora spinosa]
MTTTTRTTTAPNVRQTAVAGSAGMFIEFYEYGIYGSFAPVISTVFFPKSGGGTGLLLTYGIFAVTFLFRPLGGVILGMIGDRVGRRSALLLSLTIITISTTLIGVVPGYEVLGLAAPVLLLLFRLAQGFSAGGEVAAAVTLVGEHAPTGKRAFCISFVQAASFGALLVGTLLGVVLTGTLSEDALHSWGWRIPFLVALPLGLVGVWIRRKVSEPPAFEQLRQTDELATHPVKDAFRSGDNRRRLLMAAALPLLNSVGYYVLFNYLPTYLSKQLKFGSSASFTITSIGLMALIAAIPVAARLSDKFGRRPVLISSGIIMTVVAYPAYLVMGQGSFALAVLGIVVLAVIFAGHTGVIHTALMELFPTSVRTTSYSIGYNIGLAIFGGGGPLIVTALITSTGDPGVPAYYVILSAVVTTFCTIYLTETYNSRVQD